MALCFSPADHQLRTLAAKADGISRAGGSASSMVGWVSIALLRSLKLAVVVVAAKLRGCGCGCCELLFIF
jgi:hypothetical protein